LVIFEFPNIPGFTRLKRSDGGEIAEMLSSGRSGGSDFSNHEPRPII